MHYSLDFRIRVLKYIEFGNSKTEASKVFCVDRTTIVRWFKRRSETGSPGSLKQKRPWRKIDPIALESYVKEHPDFTLVEYARHFGVSWRGVSYALERLKITRKKRPHCTKKGVKRSVRYFWSK